MMKSHIILIGFKSAGKSVIGEALSAAIGRTFVDLDGVIVFRHLQATGEKLTCRDIMRMYGEVRFRELEHEALEGVVAIHDSLVISVGGGAPMMEANRDLMRGHILAHVTAPKSIIFERIMIHGRPAFFPSDVPAFQSFERFWEERCPVYESLADMTVDNIGSVQDAVRLIQQELNLHMV